MRLAGPGQRGKAAAQRLWTLGEFGPQPLDSRRRWRRPRRRRAAAKGSPAWAGYLGASQLRVAQLACALGRVGLLTA